MRLTGRLLLAPVLLLCLLLAGCGVPLQAEPENVRLPSGETQRAAPPAGPFTVTVFLADDARLVPVQRATSDTSLRAMLVLLAQGPTAAEAEEGLRSALGPDALDAAMWRRGPKVRGRVVEVAVTEDFTTIAGDDQLLATAQLVWTVTGGPSARRVRAVVAGEPIELPIDRGLTADPVGRGDYRTVAHRAGAG